MYAENKSLISILEENKIALFKRMVYTEDFLEQLNIEQELKNVE